MAPEAKSSQSNEQGFTIDELRLLLQEFGRHQITCQVTQIGTGNGGKCTCGWGQAERAMWVGSKDQMGGDAEALAEFRARG